MRMNDSGDNKISPQLGMVVAIVGMIVIIILAIVLIPNLKSRNMLKDEVGKNEQVVDVTDSTNSVIVPEKPEPSVSSPQELDFWDLYPSGEEQDVGNEQLEDTPLENQNETEEDPSTDGKHTLVTLRDGAEEWVLITQHLPKSDYDYTNLVCKDNRMEYYTDGKCVSFLGIDISKYQDYIDFNKVKKAGVDFVMIRVGARGYGTGQITIDDYFYDNIKRATDAGLKVGLYFVSQAINTDEAMEEAQTVLDAIGEYRIDYPIVLNMGFANNDTARIEGLTVDEKTSLSKTFLDMISAQGYTGMVYGDKEWLIKEIDLSKLTAYDFWLAQESDLPDYPYKFSMWQYSKKGNVDGISGYVNLNISFVDYSEK